MTGQTRYVLAWTSAWGVGIAALLLVSVHFAEGHLVYSLDDPYIHLAVAENILGGGYGINAEGYSSPASSLLYPILLAPTIALGWGTFGAIVINLLAVGLSVSLLLGFFWRNAIQDNENPGAILFANMMAPLLILSISGFALPMTGMEHSLHVLAVIVTIRGLVAVAEGGKVPPSLAVAVAAMPFIRFEGAALAIASIFVLIATRHLRAAVLIGTIIIVGFAAHVFVMQRLGLPPLPSSVLLKSSLAGNVHTLEARGFLVALKRHLVESMDNRWGILLALGACAILATAKGRNGRWLSLESPGSLIGAAMVFGLGAHIAAGQYGWFGRYEVYAVTILVVGGIYLLRPLWPKICSMRLLPAQIGLLAALLLVFAPYAKTAWRTPRACRNIYEQQFQMHRFVTEFFPRGVAINDLGWVSYGNDSYVLDLWGLGSETVRLARASGRLDAQAIADLAEEADVDFAMIYASWFEGKIPESWCLMATLLLIDSMTAGGDEVQFYATRASAQADMSTALDRFAPTLPARVQLERTTCPRP